MYETRSMCDEISLIKVVQSREFSNKRRRYKVIAFQSDFGKLLEGAAEWTEIKWDTSVCGLYS